MTSSWSAITQQLLNRSFSAFAQQLLSIGSGVTQQSLKGGGTPQGGKPRPGGMDSTTWNQTSVRESYSAVARTKKPQPGIVNNHLFFKDFFY